VQEIEYHLFVVQFRFKAASHWQVAEEIPPSPAGGFVFFGFENLPGPEAGLLGGVIEIRRLVENRVVMIAEHAPLCFFYYQIEAGLGVGAVADNIAEAVNSLYAAFFDVRQDSR